MTTLPPLPAKWVLESDTNQSYVYTRPMVGSELLWRKFWHAFDADGDVCLGVNFTSSMKLDELKDRASKALDNLRFVCPIIACTVEDGTSTRWKYSASADRQAWLDAAFVVEDRGDSLNASEFVESINLKRLPYVARNGTTTFLRSYLLTSSNSGLSKEYGLYLHGTHSIMDAGPAIHALNLMCEWISGGGMVVEIEPSVEWKNLPVDPITATGGPCEWETSGARYLQELAEGSAQAPARYMLAPPPYPLNVSDPRFRCTMTVSESETTAIIAATKKLGVSVTALFHAAHGLAQFKMNPVPETASLEVGFPSYAVTIALERHFKSPVDTKTHFISSSAIIPLRFAMAGPLMEPNERARLIMTAKIIQEQIDKYSTDPCLPQLCAVMMNMWQISSEADQGDKAPVSLWSSSFNNLGVLETRLQIHHVGLTIQDMCIGVRLRNDLTLHMWTLDSKFHLQAQGASAWGKEYIRTLLENTLKIASLVAVDSK